MPRFEPFVGIRYSDPSSLAELSAPPYDVIDDALRARLAAAERNVVRIDLPTDEGGEDRYGVAARLLTEWQTDGTLVRDDRPTLTVHRMSFTTEDGTVRHTTGVIGAVELWPPGAGEILPHERTTPKAKSDRLDMLRACRANLSAIWGLSLAKGLTGLLPTVEDPRAHWTDGDGVTHSVWVIEDPDVCGRISAAISAQPLVIADGHHRYETSLTYRDERRGADGPGGPADLTLCYVVELVADELTVQPIHRLVSDVEAARLRAHLDRWFEIEACEPFGPTAVAELTARGALGLATPDASFLLRPRPDRFDEIADLDSSRLDAALDGLGASVAFQHGVAHVTSAVAESQAVAGVLLRPATVDQIQAIAHGGDRMPPKTTFFSPKPPTGIVIRSL